MASPTTNTGSPSGPDSKLDSAEVEDAARDVTSGSAGRGVEGGAGTRSGSRPAVPPPLPGPRRRRSDRPGYSWVDGDETSSIDDGGDTVARTKEPTRRAGLARSLGMPPRVVGGPARIGGVAPFIEPRRHLRRWSKARDLTARGFVPLSPGRPKIRHRILPRTVIGIATMLLMLGVGAAFSGATFYAYYDARLADNERAVARFVEGFDQQFSDATGAIDELRTDTVAEIRDELEPLGEYVADANGVIQLPEVAGPSVWMVETLDEDGRLTAGAAFAAVEHEGGTALITSYGLVAASTVEPAPGIDVVKDTERIPAQLWAWDEERDLAVVVVDREIPVLEFATERSQQESVGSRVFALSGMGGGGSTASPGVLLDQSQIGLQHTAPVGTLFVGGPLLNGEGKVLGVASTGYRPLGIDPGEVAQAPDIRAICAVILECSQVRERVVVEVAADESDAPESDGTPVRGDASDVLETDTPDGDAGDGGDPAGALDADLPGAGDQGADG